MQPAYICLLIGLAVANVSIYRTILSAPLLEIQVLGAGEEHAILIRDPQGNTLLIDAGPDAGILRMLGKTLPMWERDIDAVILTSSETGSAGGLQDLKSRYRIADLVRLGARESAAAATLPYGTPLRFDSDIRIVVIAPHTVDISYGTARFSISSTTPPGIYYSDGSK